MSDYCIENDITGQQELAYMKNAREASELEKLRARVEELESELGETSASVSMYMSAMERRVEELESYLTKLYYEGSDEFDYEFVKRLLEKD